MKFSFLLPLSLFLLSACVETSSTQRGYVEARDDCRSYSEARLSLPSADKDDKTRLLSLFAECMNKRGWAVGAPGDKPKEERAPQQAAAPVIVEKPSVISYYVPPMPMAQTANFGENRAAACAYARHAKRHSALAKELAQDCDNECRNAGGRAEACPR